MGAPSMRTTWAKVIHRRPAAGLDFGFGHVYLLPRTEALASERKLHRHYPACD